MAYSDLDDVDYLVEDNVMDEFAYHRKWKRPMVEWHIGGASWEQNANAMIFSNSEFTLCCWVLP